jgi:type I restriction enzyme, S subunit
MKQSNPVVTYQYLNILPFRDLPNWSASFILRNKLGYNDAFLLMPIGKLLLKNKQKIIVNDKLQYKQVKVKLYGKGVELRGILKGSEIGTKNQFIVSQGQFIMSKIDARNGAFGIIPPELEGAIVTQDFLTYNINDEIILADFFLLITATKEFYALCQRASSGTTNRQRVDESAFLNFEIPVPPIPLQQKILDQFSNAIKAANDYNRQAQNLEISIQRFLTDSLGLKSITGKKKNVTIQLVQFKDILYWGTDKIFHSMAVNSSQYNTVSLETYPELYIEAIRGKSPRYDNKGSKIILNQKCNRWNNIQVEFAKRVNDKWLESLDKEMFTREGDILINSTGEGTIGRASYVSKDFEGFMFDSHVLLLRVNDKMLNAQYLVEVFNSPYGQSQIENLKSAKSTKQTELGIANLLKICFPLPKSDIQNSIALEIKNKRSEIKQLKEKAEQNVKNAKDDFEKSIFKG